MKKKSRELGMGDVIMVDAGRGSNPRMVDRVSESNGKVVVYLYSASGIRPKMTLDPEMMVEVADTEIIDSNGNPV